MLVVQNAARDAFVNRDRRDALGSQYTDSLDKYRHEQANLVELNIAEEMKNS